MTPTTLTLSLPWPPSVNTYWRRVGSRTLISKAGRLFRKSVVNDLAVSLTKRDIMRGRLSVKITAHPPDLRKRDLDNLPKGVLDALTHAGVWVDDEQIDDLRIIRGEVRKPGCLVVEVREQ